MPIKNLEVYLKDKLLKLSTVYWNSELPQGQTSGKWNQYPNSDLLTIYPYDPIKYWKIEIN